MIKLTSFPIKKLQKDNFKDQNLETTQSNSESLWNDIRNHPLLKGRLIENIEITTASLNVEHKLNRKPRGYIVVKKNANINIFDNALSDSLAKKFINLDASGSGTITIWVF